VPNHSSDQHPWFRESASSRDSPKRDWYLWADPAPDGEPGGEPGGKPGGEPGERRPPNNWLSEFGGPAWEWHEPTGQYYYHAFDVSQPDLNWRNPEVRRALAEVMRFWLDKGVDGFRVDVLWHLVKDDQWRDNPPNPDHDPQRESQYNALLPAFSTDQPEVHDVVAELRSVIDEYDDRLLIGEIYLPISKLVAYYGVERSGAHLPFNFQLVTTPWDAGRVRAVADEYDASVPADEWPNWVLGNHDQSRIASRVGPAQARVAAVLLLTLRGTPTLYYGDELGMENVPVPPERARDPREVNDPGRGLGRDPYRAPMRWSADPNAGFTSGEPWLPVGEGFETMNVEAERDDPASMLTLHRRLIALRRAEPALALGDYAALPAEPPLFAYQRLPAPGDASRRYAVVLNFGSEPRRWRLAGASGTVVLSARQPTGGGDRVEGEIEIAGDDALVIALDREP
jgi:alpha-glucosidase